MLLGGGRGVAVGPAFSDVAVVSKTAAVCPVLRRSFSVSSLCQGPPLNSSPFSQELKQAISPLLNISNDPFFLDSYQRSGNMWKKTLLVTATEASGAGESSLSTYTPAPPLPPPPPHPSSAHAHSFY